MKALAASARNAKRSLLTSSSMKACESSGRRWARAWARSTSRWSTTDGCSAWARVLRVGTLGDQSADQVTGAHVPDRQLPAVRPRHVVPKEARHDQRRRRSVARRKDDAARGVIHRRRAFDELGRDGRREATYEPPAWDVVQLDTAQSRSASAASRRGLHLHMSCLPDYTSYHSIYLSERYEQRLAEHPTGGETPRRQRGVRAALERPRAAPCPAGREASGAAVQAGARRTIRGAGQARAATRLRHSPCSPRRSGGRARYPPRHALRLGRGPDAVGRSLPRRRHPSRPARVSDGTR